jgi:hypothetical protein
MGVQLVDDMARPCTLKVQIIGRDASAVASWGDRFPMGAINKTTPHAVKGYASPKIRDEILEDAAA